jgi:hypothetical protein
MMIFFESIQYSLIYQLYKTRYYKSGKGYIYRANQIISIFSGLAFTMACMIFLGWKGIELAIVFAALSVPLFILLEKNVTRKKLIMHRKTYARRKKHLLYFYSLVGIVFVAIALYY